MAALRAMLQLRPGSTSSHTTMNSQLHSNSHSPLLSPADTASSISAVQSTGLQSNISTTSASNRVSSSIQAHKKPFQNLGLHSGAASGNLGLVKFALDNGQPIDSVINGVLPIHAACCSNANVPVVLFLIEHGADVNAQRCPRKYGGERAVGSQAVGTTGSTPLHFAAANGCLTIVEILLRHGAIADLADKYGTTPYAVATSRNHPEIANLLHEHAAMQRGLHVFTPDAEIKDGRDRDPFISPRNSGDFSRRVSAIMAPTRPCIYQSEPSSQSLIPPSHIVTTTMSAAAIHNLNQRRVSLPCIMESPSSPTISSAPRQSCDLGRPPLSREPFHTKFEPTDVRPSASDQKISNSSTPFQIRNFGPREKAQSSQNGLLSVLESSIINSRRKSADIAGTGLLSPPTVRSIHRRISLDQILPERPMNSKIRRDSDASTSETVVSDPSSCSTLVDDSEKPRNDSRAESRTIGRSISQPPLPLEEAIKLEVPESRARKSFDLRLFASHRQQAVTKGDEKVQNWSYRRRSIQEPFLINDFDDEKDNFLGQSSKLSLSTSTSTVQDFSPRDHSKINSKHCSSFSGSATISGRISRLWTNGSSRDIQGNFAHRKGGSAGSVGSFGLGGEDGAWIASDNSKGDVEVTPLSVTNRDIGGDKSRAGVMSRFSGIWSRR
ncbi:hypothetical protein BGX27_005651 [Mortierella sp. AM989]|nr:hypothetical protein BGX27_005651 [Mortierella sp. AM989]